MRMVAPNAGIPQPNAWGRLLTQRNSPTIRVGYERLDKGPKTKVGWGAYTRTWARESNHELR
jgi:hypothetical protein